VHAVIVLKGTEIETSVLPVAIAASFFFFFFLALLGLEFRASYLLGRCFTTLPATRIWFFKDSTNEVSFHCPIVFPQVIKQNQNVFLIQVSCFLALGLKQDGR
jgi:hypothetical protein